MLIVISPAKTLDYETPLRTRKFTQPDYLPQSQILIDGLRKHSSAKIGKLMKISPALAELNSQRYQQWQLPFKPENARQAIFAFKGDVYTGLQADNMDTRDIAWAQQHLRILSGLYGLLRPLDLMQAYRLEMGTCLKTKRGKNLYEFWDRQITDGLNQQLQSLKSTRLVNLASNEYFKSVKLKELNAQVITPVFMDWKNQEFKMIGFFAKKARGCMSAWMIKNRIKIPEKLQDFNLDGYRYDATLSSLEKPVFLRKRQSDN